jgi:outer membrane protein TolC
MPTERQRMKRMLKSCRAVARCAICVVLSGCHTFGPLNWGSSEPKADPADAARHYETMARQIEYPKVATPENPAVTDTLPPRTLDKPGELQYWDLTLEEALRIAMANSTVIHDVGGRVVDAAATTSTSLNPAIVDSDPRGGVEAALSAFDAQLALSATWNKDDRVYNSILTQLGTGSQADRAVGNIQLSKINATGTQVSLRNLTNYSAFNSPLNLFGSSYDTIVEAEVRHPFLQGGGIEFNRIAGPNAVPGGYNGVVLARINNDISLADLEQSVTGLAHDVERTYLALYSAYRDLDAQVAARNNAMQTWQSAYRRLQAGAGDAEEEATAREQYWVLQGAVDNAFSGSTNLSAGFITPTQAGVLAREAQFRQLLGLPPNDGRLIRPADEPSTVTLAWNWNESVQEAMVRRVELRRQRWVIKRREMELLASRNFLLPKLDGVAKYRWFGFGDELMGNGGVPFGSAWDTLGDGNYQEWQLGFEYSVPIGKRLGNVAVRHAELQLARDKAVLDDQERVIVHEVGDSMAQIDRTYQISRSYFNRLEAARKELMEVRKKYEAGWGIVTLDRLLDANRRVAEAESGYFRSVVDYNLSITNMYASRGALLDYDQVYLAEGDWPAKAYRDACINSAHCRPPLDYSLVLPGHVSTGPYSQFQYESASPAADLPEPAIKQPAMDTEQPAAPVQLPVPDLSIPAN